MSGETTTASSTASPTVAPPAPPAAPPVQPAKQDGSVTELLALLDGGAGSGASPAPVTPSPATPGPATASPGAMPSPTAQPQVVAHSPAPEQVAFEERLARLVATLGRSELAIGALASVPATVSGALAAAKSAQDTAKKAGEGSAVDWRAATATLDALEAKIGEISAAGLAEARSKAADFERRYTAVDETKPAVRGIAAAYSAYGKQKKSLGALIAAGDGLAALAACPATEGALAAFEAKAAPTQQAKTAAADKALLDFTALTPIQLANMPMAQKAELALDLCANGTPDDNEPDGKGGSGMRPVAGGKLDALCKLYRAAPLDQSFLDARQRQMQDIAAAVAIMPEIDALFGPDGEPDAAAWATFRLDPDKVKTLMEKVGKAQTDAIGMGKIDINKQPDPPEGRDPEGSLTFGGYNPNTNTIDLNLHDECLPDLNEALGTIIHETFHAHQDVLVKKLKAGEIDETDPLYGTAMICLVNDIGVGYVAADLGGQANYEAQPTELDAEGQSRIAAALVLAAVKARKQAPTANPGPVP